jgi:hypothetical protein
LWIIWNYFWSAYLVICVLISLINFAVFWEIYWVVSAFEHSRVTCCDCPNWTVVLLAFCK